MKRRYTRKLWVDPRYQVVQMAAVVLANILVALLIAGLLSWFYLLVWDGSVAVNHNQRIPIYVAVAALAVTLVTVYCSLRRSRAIAGMMKKLHTVLSEAGINIATFHLGRAAPGGDAICLVGLDGPIPEDVLARVRSLPLVVQATPLAF